MTTHYKSIIGQKFNNLTVISLSHTGEGRRRHWLCQCDCGNKITTCTKRLKNGERKSCGCLNKFNQNHRWQGEGELSASFWGSIKTLAKRRNLEFSITIEDAWNQFLKQDKKCALSGCELTFGSNRKDKNKTASLDRIDNTKGYTLDNIQWLHKKINAMKSDLPERVFLEFVQSISDYQSKNFPKNH